MITDSAVNFVPPGSPLSLVGAAGVAISSAIYDILGVGVGVAPQGIIGTRTLFGEDLGVGESPLLDVVMGIAAATANAATLNVQFQGAVDTGAAGGYLPGAWITLVETGPLAAAALTAGAVIARFPFAMAVPPGTLPRFLRLNFALLAATNFSAGSIAFATVTKVRDDWTVGYAAKGFVVA
jgi:hypothetical protein